MNFGTKFGVQKRKGGGANNVKIGYTSENLYVEAMGTTGTHDFLLLPNGFEFEVFGDGSNPNKPNVLVKFSSVVPAGTQIEWSCDVEFLSGVSPFAYSFVSWLSGAAILGTTSGHKSGTLTTSMSGEFIIFMMNERKTGRVRVTNIQTTII